MVVLVFERDLTLHDWSLGEAQQFLVRWIRMIRDAVAEGRIRVNQFDDWLVHACRIHILTFLLLVGTVLTC